MGTLHGEKGVRLKGWDLGICSTGGLKRSGLGNPSYRRSWRGRDLEIPPTEEPEAVGIWESVLQKNEGSLLEGG